MQQEAIEVITNTTTTTTSTFTTTVATTTITDVVATASERTSNTIREHERSAKARASRLDNAAGTYLPTYLPIPQAFHQDAIERALGPRGGHEKER